MVALIMFSGNSLMDNYLIYNYCMFNIYRSSVNNMLSNHI